MLFHWLSSFGKPELELTPKENAEQIECFLLAAFLVACCIPLGNWINERRCKDQFTTGRDERRTPLIRGICSSYF